MRGAAAAPFVARTRSQRPTATIVGAASTATNGTTIERCRYSVPTLPSVSTKMPRIPPTNSSIGNHDRHRARVRQIVQGRAASMPYHSNISGTVAHSTALSAAHGNGAKSVYKTPVGICWIVRTRGSLLAGPPSEGTFSGAVAKGAGVPIGPVPNGDTGLSRGLMKPVSASLAMLSRVDSSSVRLTVSVRLMLLNPARATLTSTQTVDQRTRSLRERRGANATARGTIVARPMNTYHRTLSSRARAAHVPASAPALARDGTRTRAQKQNEMRKSPRASFRFMEDHS